METTVRVDPHYDLGSARLVTVPGLGHALPQAVHAPLAEAILEHTGRG